MQRDAGTAPGGIPGWSGGKGVVRPLPWESDADGTGVAVPRGGIGPTSVPGLAVDLARSTVGDGGLDAGMNVGAVEALMSRWGEWGALEARRLSRPPPPVDPGTRRRSPIRVPDDPTRVVAGDKRATRILAKADAAVLAPSGSAATAAAEALALDMLRPVAGGRKHTVEGMAALRRGLRAAVEPVAGVVAAYASDATGRPRTNPRHRGIVVRVDAAALVDDGWGAAGHVRLRATTFEAERDQCSVGWFPLPVDWTAHAAERVLERVRDAGPNVHASMGATLARLAPAISVMADEAMGAGRDLQVAVPYAGGLLVGSTGLVQAGVASSSQAHGARSTRRGARQYRKDPLTSWAGLFGTSREATWTAVTFVAGYQLKDDQRAYAMAFEALAGGIGLDVVARAVMWSSIMPRWNDASGDPAAKRDEGDDRDGEAIRDGVDREGFRDLARKAIASGVVGPRRQGQDVRASAPVRARDHDRDPVARAVARLG